MYTTIHPDGVEDTRTDEQKKIDTLNEAYAEASNAVRNNGDLSYEASRRGIAKAFIALKDGLDAVRDGINADTSTRRALLERKIFGIPNQADPAAMISYRDALQRANNIEKETEAVTTVRQAHISGDDHMVRAVLAIAYPRDWAEVVNTYESLVPAVVTEAEELWGYYAADNNTRSLFHDGLKYHAVVPSELINLADYSIRELANS